MKFKLLAALLILSVTLLLAFATATFSKQSGPQDKPSVAQTEQKQKKIDPNIPIADYAVSTNANIDAAQQQARQAKNAFYHRDEDFPLRDPGPNSQSQPGQYISHLFIRLSPLPVKESDAIIIGTFKASAAILAEDKTNVHSEFTIDVERVFKTETLPVGAGQSFVAERFGGAVRFPSGVVEEYRHLEQNYPRIGGRYVLFLKRESQVNVRILTGYELLNEKVRPLDDYQAFQVYKDQPESDLIADLTSALEKGGK
jgi:hypothetical protein